MGSSYNPLDDMLAGGSGGPPNPLDEMLSGGSSADPIENDLTTARGRRRSEVQNAADNAAKLEALLQNPKVTPAQRKRIEMLLQKRKSEASGWTRPNEEKRSTASNLARGAAAGAINAFASTADLAAVPLDLLGSDVAKDFRQRAAESREIVTEHFDPEGKAGLVGEFAGGIAGSIPGYGAAANLTAKGAYMAFPRLARLVQAGKMSEKMATRIATQLAENVGTGVAINATQAAGMEGATTQEKLKEFAIGTIADAGFGTLAGIRRPKPPGVPVKGKTPPTTGDGPVDPKRAEALAKMAEKRMRDQVQKEAKKALENLAKADWQQKHPTLDWKKVPADQKAKIIAEWLVANKTKVEEVSTEIRKVVDERKGAGAGNKEGEAQLGVVENEDLGNWWASLPTEQRNVIRQKYGIEDGLPDHVIRRKIEDAYNDAKKFRDGPNSIEKDPYNAADWESDPEYKQAIAWWSSLAQPQRDELLKTLKGSSFPEFIAMWKKESGQGPDAGGAAAAKPPVPPKPIDPIQAKLEQLKADMAAGKKNPAKPEEPKPPINRFRSYQDWLDAMELGIHDVEPTAASFIDDIKGDTPYVTEEAVNRLKQLIAVKKMLEDAQKNPESMFKHPRLEDIDLIGINTQIDRIERILRSAGFTTKDLEIAKNEFDTAETTAKIKERIKVSEHLRMTARQAFSGFLRNIGEGDRDGNWWQKKFEQNMRELTEQTGKNFETIREEYAKDWDDEIKGLQRYYGNSNKDALKKLNSWLANENFHKGSPIGGVTRSTPEDVDAATDWFGDLEKETRDAVADIVGPYDANGNWTPEQLDRLVNLWKEDIESGGGINPLDGLDVIDDGTGSVKDLINDIKEGRGGHFDSKKIDDWWRNLTPQQAYAFLLDAGAAKGVDPNNLPSDWRKLPPKNAGELVKFFGKYVLPDLERNGSGSRRLDPNDQFLGRKENESPDTWWDSMDIQMHNEVLKALGIDGTLKGEGDERALVELYWKDLPVEIQSQIAMEHGRTFPAKAPPPKGEFSTVDDLLGGSVIDESTGLDEGQHQSLVDFVLDHWDNKGDLLERLEAWADAEGVRLDDAIEAYERVSGRQVFEDLTPTSDPSTPLQNPIEQAFPDQPSPLTPTSELTLAERREALFEALDADPDNPELLARLSEVLDAEKLASNQGVVPPAPDVSEVVPPTPTHGMDASVDFRVDQPKDAGLPQMPRMDPKEFQTLARTSPRKLSDEQLNRLWKELDYRIALMAKGEGPELRTLLNKVTEELKNRGPRPPLDLNSPREIGAGIISGLAGYAQSNEETEEGRMSEALAWAAVGAGGVWFGTKAFRQRQASIRAGRRNEWFPGHKDLPKVVIGQDDIVERRLGLMTRFRRFYQGTVRSSHGIERLTGESLPAHLDPGKLASLFGRWVATSERWMTDRPVVMGPDGNPVYLLDYGLKHVEELVNGDLEGLGELMVAMTSLELGGRQRVPMNIVDAAMIFQNAPQEYIDAATKMRQYFLALAKTQVMAGNLSEEGFRMFEVEEWYTPLYRIFGPEATLGEVEKIAKGGDVVTSPNPLRNRKGGSQLHVKNPFEMAVELTPRYIKAMEYALVKQRFVSWVRAQPKEISSKLMSRVDRHRNPSIDKYQLYIDAIKKSMGGISEADAANIALTMGLEDIDPKNPVMTVYEEGVLRQYKIDEEVFEAFKAMMPSESSIVTKITEGLSIPTRTAAKGIVHHPAFIATQAFIDTFQVALMSRYGFRPGIDSIRGWWHVVRRSPQYKQLLDLGGPSTIQSLNYTDVKKALGSLSVEQGNALSTAWKNMKELRPFEAYKTLMLPLAEAARVGEALRAMDHGAPVIEAVYAAWHAAGNNRMQGSFAAIRGLNMLALFTRPAISALDELVAKTGLHPFRTPVEGRLRSGTGLLTKGFAFIGLPSMYFWYANKDDEEIKQLRQTNAGQKYWFIRKDDGSIIRLRKPHVLGQLFGTTVEQTLDAMYSQDAAGVESMFGSLLDDAIPNMMPQLGVIPVSLFAGRQFGTGTPIIPMGDEGLETQYQGYLNATNPARFIAEKAQGFAESMPENSWWGQMARNSLTPAGIDFTMNTVAGMLGQDFMRLIDVAMDKQKGLPPSKEELPVIGRYFARYPAMNVKPVKDFYANAQRIDEVANTMNYLAQRYPERLARYIESNQEQIPLIDLYASTRRDVGSIRRALVDMKIMYEEGKIPHKQYKDFERGQLLQIIELYKIAGEITGQMRR